MQDGVEITGDAVPLPHATPVASHGEAGATPVASRPATGEETVVTIVDFAFEPAEIEISAGSTVTWVNEGQTPHTATASDGNFDTGVIVPAADGSQTFDEPGEFAYFCAIHPDMQGAVVVRS